MTRPRRCDSPGRWHHVWGRGLAKKPIFESRRDIRRFQAALARAVRRGDIEVHSFAFLTTHFHLLVRSPRGRLSQALGRVLWDFTRHYNRSRDRDGTVWRGRFSSKPVQSLTYRRILVRYIDRNPVQAGLTNVPWQYEHGSAQRFVYRTPRWLSRTWVDEEIRKTLDRPGGGGRYEDAFPLAGDRIARLAEAREASARSGPDPLDSLVEAAPEEVRQWFHERSHLADGTSPGHPVVDTTTLARVLQDVDAQRPAWTVRPFKKTMPGMRLVAVAVYRELAGLTLTAVAHRVGVSIAYVKRLHDLHRTLLVTDRTYADVVLDVTARALALLRSDS